MDQIVVGDRVLFDGSFRAARTRLEILARDGILLRASEVAYGEGTTVLVKAAGPGRPDPAGRDPPGKPGANGRLCPYRAPVGGYRG